MSELKPCPFCGADAEVTDHGSFKIAGCSNLSMLCPSPSMTIYDDDFSHWNHREEAETEKRLSTDKQNAISLMSPSWKHAAKAEPNIMTRYVTMAENQFKRKNEEIERLTAMATKHATRSDELYELLEKQKSDIEKMLDQLFHHENVDAWLVCKMNDMIDDVNHQLGMSQIDTVSDSSDD